MKIIVVICTFLFISTAWGQQRGVYVALDSIINRGLERGVDIRPLLEIHLDTIRVLDAKTMPRPKNPNLTTLLGRANFLGFDKKNRWTWDIIIAEELLNDFQMLERVLAHELGHTIHMKHCCQEALCLEIMSTGHVTEPSNMFYRIQFHPQESIRFWDVFFQNLKCYNKME